MAQARISCIICAYNEATRIEQTLRAVLGHPLLGEVIVVNDGSTDDTERRVRAHPDVNLITYAQNRGKTHALGRGIIAARCDYLMLLDADLLGIEAEDIEALAAPVLNGEAEVSISLRKNTLGLYRRLGLDFVSGERVMPTSLVRVAASAMLDLPRWGGEVFMNQLIIHQALRVAVVDWPEVSHARKREKVGSWRAAVSELEMVGDAFKVLTPVGVVRQNLAMLKLVTSREAINRPRWRDRAFTSRAR